jgi:hypothetical protein
MPDIRNFSIKALELWDGEDHLVILYIAASPDGSLCLIGSTSDDEPEETDPAQPDVSR